MNKYDYVGMIAVREDGRVIDYHYGQLAHSEKWIRSVIGAEGTKMLFSSKTGCGIGAANDNDLSLNTAFPPYRGIIVIVNTPQLIKQTLNNIGGDAAYYDKLDALAARGVPVSY